MKNFYSWILASAMFIAGGASLLSGCGKSTLAPGGAYAPDPTTNATTGVVTQPAADPAFFNVDLAYDTAWSAMNVIFTFEHDNRLTLWAISHNIKHELDKIRPQAVAADKEYVTARAAYMANPTPAGLTGLTETLAKMQQLVSAARAVTASNINTNTPTK